MVHIKLLFKVRLKIDIYAQARFYADPQELQPNVFKPHIIFLSESD